MARLSLAADERVIAHATALYARQPGKLVVTTGRVLWLAHDTGRTGFVLPFGDLSSALHLRRPHRCIAPWAAILQPSPDRCHHHRRHHRRPPSLPIMRAHAGAPRHADRTDRIANAGQRVSKEGQERVQLQLVAADAQQTKTVFTFTEQDAVADRDRIRDAIRQRLAQHRASVETAAVDAGAANEEMRSRARRLASDADLSALYQELVRDTGLLSEEEFWTAHQVAHDAHSCPALRWPYDANRPIRSRRCRAMRNRTSRASHRCCWSWSRRAWERTRRLEPPSRRAPSSESMISIRAVRRAAQYGCTAKRD